MLMMSLVNFCSINSINYVFIVSYIFQKSKNKSAAQTMMDETLNEIPPEFRTKTGRIRQPVNYNFGESSESEDF